MRGAFVLRFLVVKSISVWLSKSELEARLFEPAECSGHPHVKSLLLCSSVEDRPVFFLNSGTHFFFLICLIVDETDPVFRCCSLPVNIDSAIF